MQLFLLLSLELPCDAGHMWRVPERVRGRADLNDIQNGDVFGLIILLGACMR